MRNFILFSLMLTFLFSCTKKTTETPAPVVVEKPCLIQKVSYDDGTYELYKFDANDRLAEATLTYEDNGKIIPVLMKYEYNASGNLLKTTNPYNWTDNYIYDASGVLTRVDFKDEKGQLDEQFTVTMDAQKRITKIVTKKDALTGTYEYNGPNGVFSKSEVRWQGKILEQYISSTYEDTSKKTFSVAIKGHPFDPSVFTSDMVYSEPYNFQPLNYMIVSGKISTQWDENYIDVVDKVRVSYDFTATRKYNAKSFVTERTSKDVVSKQTYIKTFTYSNCN